MRSHSSLLKMAQNAEVSQQRTSPHTFGSYLGAQQHQVLTSTCARQKMPDHNCKDTFRTAKNEAWRPGTYFLPLESGHFQLTSCEEASQQGSQGFKVNVLPRRVLSSWKPLGPAERHLQLLPLRGKPDERSISRREEAVQLRVRASSLESVTQRLNSHLCPRL